ncbi:DUF1302 domain-containing protein [Endozoicomonas arenosclerae]|uniref:DUF1302 domain-containing protein n=1 Tax=Endozoicomonas arenosclerae TaxID=1633495 RepID=UPI000AE0A98C|nr:DUF1302 domain-containing protein [Endozoicomonas arenosclerae]
MRKPFHYKALYTAIALATPISSQALILDFDNPEIRGYFDTTFSYNTMFRAENPDFRPSEDFLANANDGSRNSEKGDQVSSIYKITSDFQIDYKEFGAFIRATAWYDDAIKGQNPKGDPNIFSNSGTVDRFTRDAKNKASGGKILDAYISYNFDIGTQPANIRIGRQAVNWGESIFYAEGLNVINPLNIEKFSLPGTSVKEAVIPQNMIFFQTGITDDLSLEAYYQLEWRKAEFAPIGTFLTQEDLDGPGSLGGIADVRSIYSGLANPAGGTLLDLLPTVNGTPGIVSFGRAGKEIEAKDDGQFGVAFRYLAEDLGGTEFSAYFINYHSRIGYGQLAEASSTNSCSNGNPSAKFSALCNALYTVPGLGDFPAAPFANSLQYLDDTRLNKVFPEDIRVYGLSASGNLGSTNLAAEITYRPNVPIETDSSEAGALQAAAQQLVPGEDGSIPGAAPVNYGDLGTIGTGGAVINQYKRGEVYSLTLNGLHSFGQQGIFEDVSLTAELASNFVPGSLIEKGSFAYIDRFSWGYNLFLQGRIANILPNLTLYPSLSFKHDAEGNSRIKVNHFVENRKQASIGLSALYKGQLGASIAYNAYWGNKDANPLHDRDNITLGISYSF